MAWWAIVVDASGESVSFTSMLPDPIPPGLVAISVAQQPDHLKRWNKTLRQLEDVPVDPPPPGWDHGNLSGLADDDHPQYATDAALSTHEAAADPHSGYVREADANWLDLTDNGETALHSHAGGGVHPDLATHNTLGLATQAELDAHEAAADPHIGYLKESDTSWLDLTDSGPTTLHSHAGAGGISTLKTTGNQTINGTAFQNITGLTFAVSANTDYAFHFRIIFQSAQTTTGFRFGLNGPAGTALEYTLRYQTVANSATAGVATYLDQHNVGYDQMTALTATIAANVDLYAEIEGTIRVGVVEGTLAARVASEAANNDLSIRRGSWGTYF